MTLNRSLPTPSATAILLAYRHASTITAAIDSVLAQTLPVAEIIISDDASDDDTFEIARQHVAKCGHPHAHRITLRRNPKNLGLIGHVDLLVRSAKHELIIGFAGDDVSFPNRVEKTLKAWQQLGRPSRCLIHGNVETLDETPGRILRPPVAALQLSVQQIAFASSLHIGATTSFTRDLWLDWPAIFEPGVFEDLALGFRAALGGQYVYLDDLLVRYRLHGGLGDPARRQPVAQRLASLKGLLRHRLQDLDHFIAGSRETLNAEPLAALRASLADTLASPVFDLETAHQPAVRRNCRQPALAEAVGHGHGTRPRISVVVPVVSDPAGWLALIAPMLRQQRFPNVEWITVLNHDLGLDEDTVRRALPGELRIFRLRRCQNEVRLMEAGLRVCRGDWILPLHSGQFPGQDALRTLLAHAEVNQADWVTSRPALTLGGVFSQDFAPDGDICNVSSRLGLTLYRRGLARCRPCWWTCSSVDQYLLHWHLALAELPSCRHAFLNARLAVRAAGPGPSAAMLHDLLLPYARRSVPLVDTEGNQDPLCEPPDYQEWLAEVYAARNASPVNTPALEYCWAVMVDARGASDAELAHSLAAVSRQQGYLPRVFVLDGRERIPAPWLAPGERISTFSNETELDAAARDFAAAARNPWWLFLCAGDVVLPDAFIRLEQSLSPPRHETVRVVYFDHDEWDANGLPEGPHFKPAPNPALLRSTFYPGRALVVRHDWLLALELPLVPLPQHLLYRLCLRTFETEADYLAAHCPGILAHLTRRVPAVGAIDDESWAALAEELSGHAKRLHLNADVIPGPGPGTFHFINPLERTPKVSILIATKEQLPLLQRCLESLLQHTDYPDFEIIVVDNGSSSPNCVAFLKGLETLAPKRLRVLYAPGPFNFSRLNNLAAREATGELLLLLNNDTAALKPDWLIHMVRHALCEDVAAVGARLAFPDGTVQHAGIVTGLHGAADHPFLGDPLSAPGYLLRAQLTQNYSAVTAACLLVRKALYEEVGGLDEGVFAVSFNDVDFCLRLAATGRRIVWTPLAVLLHEGSASQRAQVEAADFSMKRQRFTCEQQAFLERWPDQVLGDPAYNDYLSLASRGFEIETNVHAIRRDCAPESRPRIVGFPADRHGCGHYRVLQPLQALIDADLAEGGISHEHLPVHLALRGSADTLVLQRPHTDLQLDLLESYPVGGRPFKIYELDDLLDRVPAYSVHQATLPRDMRARMERGMARCDRLVLSTEALAEELAGLNPDIRVVPNCLPPRLWGTTPPPRPETDAGQIRRPRVGWAGGIGHLGDLHVIEEVVRILADEVDWEFFGMCPDFLRPYVRHHVSGVPTEFYPARLMALAAEWDVAVAPLEDNRFNNCKSNLRLLEYGWCGVPVVCSNLEPYRGSLAVTRVANRVDAWLDAIRAHVHSMETSRAAGLALQQQVAADHLLAGNNLHAWLAAWRP